MDTHIPAPICCLAISDAIQYSVKPRGLEADIFATSKRRSNRTPRSAIISPSPTAVTSMKQARSASGSRYFSPYLLPPMSQALAHQSLVSLVALLLLLLELDVVLEANPLFSCTACKCSKPRPTAQFSLLPFK